MEAKYKNKTADLTSRPVWYLLQKIIGNSFSQKWKTPIKTTINTSFPVKYFLSLMLRSTSVSRVSWMTAVQWISHTSSQAEIQSRISLFSAGCLRFGLSEILTTWRRFSDTYFSTSFVSEFWDSSFRRPPRWSCCRPRDTSCPGESPWTWNRS